MAVTTQPATGSRARRTAYIVVAVVLGVGMGVGTFALPSLVGPWFGIEGREAHRVHDLGWGALGGLIVTVGLFAQVRPERAIAPLRGVLAALVALLLAAAVSASINVFALIPLVVGGVLVALHPTRGDLVPRRAEIDIPLAAVTAVAAIPLVIYALDQAALQRACGPVADTHCEEFHWSSMAALGFGLPLAGLAAALRAPGWRFLAWLVGLAAAVFGLSSIVFPQLASSVGRSWGAAAVAGGVLFVAVAEWRARGTDV